MKSWLCSSHALVIAQNYEELDAIQRKFDALITEIRSSMGAPN